MKLYTGKKLKKNKLDVRNVIQLDVIIDKSGMLAGHGFNELVAQLRILGMVSRYASYLELGVGCNLQLNR